MARVQRREALRASLFAQQRAAAECRDRLQHWQCDRRAGKTTAAVAGFIDDARNRHNSEYAYIALTRNAAERIAWPILREMKRQFAPELRLRENKLRAELPTGCALTLYGADRPDWIDRLYGQELRDVYVDEAAFYSISMRRLIDDVLEPTTAKQEGRIVLMSRPGHLQQGLFWEIASGKEGGWTKHCWSWRDNDAVRPQVEKLLARREADNPGWIDLPSTRRNWFNEWSNESGERVYHFDFERNAIRALPWDVENPPRSLHFVLGVDLGWFDQSAFVVGAYSPEYPEWYELESYAQREMTLDKVASRIRMYLDLYPGLTCVCDPGGGRSRQAFESLRARYQLPLLVADKQEKRHWIDQYNTDLLGGLIKIVNAESSPHVAEMQDLTWQRRSRDIEAGNVNDDVVERPGALNDCCDAALYAYRYARHYRHRPAEEKPEAGSRAHYEEVERDWLAQRIKRSRQRRHG